MSVILNIWWFLGLLASLPICYTVGHIVGYREAEKQYIIKR